MNMDNGWKYYSLISQYNCKSTLYREYYDIFSSVYSDHRDTPNSPAASLHEEMILSKISYTY
jgi:hypothetical protein